MKRWRLTIEAEQAVPLWLATGLLEGVGTPGLAGCFLRTIQRSMAASHCTIFALDQGGGASAISAASSYGDAATETAYEYIRQGFDRQDSNMVWLAARKTPRRSQVWLSHQSAEEVANLTYRLICYGEPGIRERVSVLLLLDTGQRIAISFYRGLAFEAFAPAELDLVSQCSPLLLSAVTAHLRKASPIPQVTPLRERILLELPRREREVIAHVLDGRTTRDIARRMKLSDTTVLTYRYRAFAKLGVRTHHDLLVLADRSA